MGSQGDNNGTGQGFDGLSSMVSDVDATIESAKKRSQAPPEPPPQATSNSSNRSTSNSGSTFYQPAQKPSGGVPVFKWILIIGGVIFVGSLIMSGSGKKKSTANASTKNYSSSSSNYNNTYSQSERFTEQMPSVGRNNVLSSAEIRYCLAQDIRIEGARSATDNYNQYSVDRFNRMVEDYNSRCGEYRYRRGALESARADVEPYRYTLLAEGRSRM